MNAVFDPVFYRKLKKLNVRISNKVKERMLLFSKNPKDLQLNNHLLKVPYKGYRSIDITSDYRAVFEIVEIGDETVAYFFFIGTHKELYGE